VPGRGKGSTWPERARKLFIVAINHFHFNRFPESLF